MTEEEAFNDTEMKTILILSGYARELGEGKDMVETTTKTAETIVKIFSIYGVSQQSELLEAYQHFIDWNEEHDRKASTSERIDAFIASNCG